MSNEKSRALRTALLGMMAAHSSTNARQREANSNAYRAVVQSFDDVDEAAIIETANRLHPELIARGGAVTSAGDAIFRFGLNLLREVPNV